MRAMSQMIIALSAGSVPGTACAANLIRDAGFETPVVPQGNLERFSTGDKIGPWTVIGASGTVDLISTTYAYDGFTFNAASGRQWLDLTGSTQTATGVTQSFATTPGARYRLHFFVGSVYDTGGVVGTSSTVYVSQGSTQIYKAVAKGMPGSTHQTWRGFNVVFTASAARTSLSFINGDPANDTDCGLDAVSVTPVAAADAALVEGLR